MALWRRQPLTIPPNSLSTWVQLAVWEVWMGAMICMLVGFGASIIVTSPERIYKRTDISACYAAPPVTLPCERVFYGGALNVAFTAFFGAMLIGGAAWFAWELWSAVEPKPITDDFLKLLNDSFGRNWRDPRTWPWARVFWAYGFTAVGATLTLGVGLVLWMSLASPRSAKAPTPQVETSQSFTLSP